MNALALQMRLALRYLWGRKARSVLTTLSIIFGVMIIFGLNGMLPAIKTSFQQNLNASADLVDITLTSQSRGTFSTAVVTQIEQSSGIKTATGALIRPMILPEKYVLPTSGLPINMLLVNGIDPATVQGVRLFPLNDGHFFTASNAQEIILPTTMAEKTGLQPGDTVILPATSGQTSFTIVGLTSGRPSFGAEIVYVPLQTAQQIFNAPGQVNTVEASLADGADGAEVRAQLLAAFGDSYKLGGNETGTELQTAVELADFIFIIIGVISMTMGGFIIFNTFRTVIMERRRDIGMLRALGASRGTIIGMILGESLLQGIIGTTLGLLMGFLATKPVEAFLRMDPNFIMGAVFGGLHLMSGMYLFYTEQRDEAA